MSGFLHSQAGSKRFKKQYFAKVSDGEVVRSKDMNAASMHNENLTKTGIVWFDPMLDPKIVNLKRPEKSELGDVAFSLFAAHPSNAPCILGPQQHAVVGTGFALNAGLSENAGFGDYPNWFATVHGLRPFEQKGVLTGTSIIRPYDHREIKIALFNMGQDVVEIKPEDPVAELVFSACHVPDIATCHETLVKCFEGNYLKQLFVIELKSQANLKLHNLDMYFFRFTTASKLQQTGF